MSQIDIPTSTRSIINDTPNTVHCYERIYIKRNKDNIYFFLITQFRSSISLSRHEARTSLSCKIYILAETPITVKIIVEK